MDLDSTATWHKNLNDSLTKSTAASPHPLEDLEGYLVYILPVLVAVVLPFSPFNMYLLCLSGGVRKPSHILYLNLLGTGT